MTGEIKFHVNFPLEQVGGGGGVVEWVRRVGVIGGGEKR